MYKYDTHIHTAPVSKCARASVRDTVEFYKKLDYDGIFITNHFLDANINIDYDLPYKTKLDFYLSDYHEAVKIGKEIGIKVFFGAELTYGGSDFLIYGLDEQWYYDHPEIMEMDKKVELALMHDSGALCVHAHPFREANYIDHIRLYPRSIQAVEVVNAGRTDFENKIAGIYAKEYDFPVTAGSDNHVAQYSKKLAGVYSPTPINSEQDFIDHVLARDLEVFHIDNPILPEEPPKW